MARTSQIAFIKLIKAHAYGNDFLIAPAPLPADVEFAALARRVCDRHRGVGADGLMLVERRPGGAAMQLRNADGSPSEVSGNGLRCIAAWLALQDETTVGARVSIETDAGVKPLDLLSREGRRFTFRAGMGAPEGVREVALEVGGQPVSVVALRVGNPQCVVLGPATPDRLRSLAAPLAVHAFFPEGTNVELAEVLSSDRVRILIWERGAGPTESSGTGTCAAAVAAAAFGGAGRDVTVDAPGGSQRVEWTDDGLFLTGWAEVVAEVNWWHH